MLRGMTPEDARQAEWRRGTLPPGQLGWRHGHRDPRPGRAAGARGRRTAGPQRHAVDVDIELGAGRRLTGTVSPVFGERLVSVTYSKLDGKHLLAAWIPLLALIAAQPRRDWSAACVGRPRHGNTPRVTGLGRPAEDPVGGAGRSGGHLRRRAA